MTNSFSVARVMATQGLGELYREHISLAFSKCFRIRTFGDLVGTDDRMFWRHHAKIGGVEFLARNAGQYPAEGIKADHFTSVVTVLMSQRRVATQAVDQAVGALPDLIPWMLNALPVARLL